MQSFRCLPLRLLAARTASTGSTFLWRPRALPAKRFRAGYRTGSTRKHRRVLDEKYARLRAIPVGEADRLPLAEPCARRWVWNRRINSWNEGVTVATLLGSLIFEEFEHLADWDKGYVAGDCTHLEIASRMWAPIFEDCPGPYVEVRGELGILDGLVARHRGVFIVAAEDFGALPLVRTWCWRALAVAIFRRISHRCGAGMESKVCSRREDGVWDVRHYLRVAWGFAHCFTRTANPSMCPPRPRAAGSSSRRHLTWNRQGAAWIPRMSSGPSRWRRQTSLSAWPCGYVRPPMACSKTRSRVYWPSCPTGILGVLPNTRGTTVTRLYIRSRAGTDCQIPLTPSAVRVRPWVRKCLREGAWRAPVAPARWRALDSLTNSRGIRASFSISSKSAQSEYPAGPRHEAVCGIPRQRPFHWRSRALICSEPHEEHHPGRQR